MTALPHPLLDQKMQQNFEYLEGLNREVYVYREFFSESRGIVFTLPKNALILFGTIVFVTDAFDAGIAVNVGDISTRGSVFSAVVDEGGKVPEIIVGNLDSNVIKNNTPVYIGFSGQPTRGKGWFLIKYLLVDRLR